MNPTSIGKKASFTSRIYRSGGISTYERSGSLVESAEWRGHRAEPSAPPGSAATARAGRSHDFAETSRGGRALRKKLAVAMFVSGVVAFDAAGYHAYHLPVWPFLPMWVGAMAEVELGSRAIAWLSKVPRLSRRRPHA